MKLPKQFGGGFQEALAKAKAVADRDKSPGVSNGYASMMARQIVETARWEKIELPNTAVRDGGAPGYDGSAAYVLAAGLGAAKLGDLSTANVAVERLRALRTQAESGSNAYRAKPFAIMEKEVAAAVASAKKDVAGAEQLLKEATVIELTLDAPSGPPEPIKPSFELYAEWLLEQGRTKDAATQFEQALKRMPNRRASVQGLQRATAPRSTSAGQ